MPDVGLCEAEGYVLRIGVNHIRRLIIYDRAWLAGMPLNRDRNEVAMVMIAHEMGHFFLRQRERLHPRDTLANELAADEFAGFAMRRLGLDTGIGARAFRQVVDHLDNRGPTPGRNARIAAFERGFNAASPPVATPQAVPEAEEPEASQASPGKARPTAADESPAASVATPSPSLWRRLVDFIKEAGGLIATIGGAIGALYGGYRWLRRRRRRVARSTQ